MTREITYIDCGSGVAGDMLIGALVDLGLSAEELNRVLHRAIPEKGWTVRIHHTERQGWPARAVTVQGDRPFGSSEKMKAAVAKAALPAPVKDRAIKILSLLQWAERHAHGTVHDAFDPHGLGLLDTLVDVVGVSWGFWRMGIEHLAASSLNTGRIAPATAQMIQKFKIPIYSDQTRYELATPTGVAILATIAEGYGSIPSFRLGDAGYGAGQRDVPGKPNVLALYRATSVSASKDFNQDSVVLLETVMDDMDPRLYPHVSDLLFNKGALDVWWAPIGMKKGRPGMAFSVLCRPELEQEMLRVIFRETTTLGVRRSPLTRWVLPRESRGIRKIARLPGGRLKSQVEYELARALTKNRDVPLKKLLK